MRWDHLITTLGPLSFDFQPDRQVRLASEDLKMMVDEASGQVGGSVDLVSFLRIIEHSAWY